MKFLIPPPARPVPARLSAPADPAAPSSCRRPPRPLPRWLRTVSTFLLPVYLVSSLPGYLLAQADQATREAAAAVAAGLQPSPAAPPEFKVSVNRTLPADVLAAEAARGARPATGAGGPRFSDAPTDEEILRASPFEEPLVPTEAKAAAGESAALARALSAYARVPVPGQAGGEETGRLAPLTGFLARYPTSRWGLTLWLNLGIAYRRAGYWTLALDAWEHAWSAGKVAREPRAALLADRAAAELAELNARLGRFERLAPLFVELDGAKRTLHGAAADKLMGARQGLWMMDHRPEAAFRCGPMALERLRAAADPAASMEPRLFESRSTRQGIALSQVAALSREIGRPMQMARRVVPAPAATGAPAGGQRFTRAGGRAAGAAETGGVGGRPSVTVIPDFVVPAVVHWKAGHYAALLEERNGRYRVEDPTFGDIGWIGRDALEKEASGYFLVAADRALPAGWRVVGEKEGAQVWGKGTTGTNDPTRTRCDDCKSQSGTSCQICGGMAGWDVHAMLVSLALADTPLSYAPPRGEAVAFTARYAQRAIDQPAVTPYWNLGPKWTSDWLSYVDFCKVDPSVPPIVYLRGGGVEAYPTPVGTPTYYYDIEVSNPPPAYVETAEWAPQDESRARLRQTGLNRFEKLYPDGSKDFFGFCPTPDNVVYPRRCYLTRHDDARGNSTRFHYDDHSRLRAVEDALGQITVLDYQSDGDPHAASYLRVSRLTDPFGRTCQLDYNDQGQLAAITDTAGIQSAFAYEAGSDFINALTTPYGTTTFARGDASTDPALGTTRWLEATDPYGDRSRTEYRQDAPGIPSNEPVVPQGINTFNSYINARNSFYWDKKAYKEARQADGTLDYTKARLTHFLHTKDINVTSGIVESTKMPFENRVWLNYEGQIHPAVVNDGMKSRVSAVGRVLDDGSSQVSRYEYNVNGRPTKSTDPLGRQITCVYADNDTDLLEVRRTTGGLNELLARTTYNGQHQPLRVTDASGQTTTLSYNDAGQPRTVKDPLNRTTTFNYDSQGYLQEIVSPEPTVKSAFAYDGFGRLASTTAYPDAYSVQVGYEAVGGDPLKTLNRPATATFPDGSYTETDYSNLSVEWTRDRAGQWTHLLTNKLRQTEAVIDPLGRITQFGYCKCGSLQSIVDPNGNLTRWTLDAQGRPTSKVMADGSTTEFHYENTTSRLKRVTDAKGQSVNYAYNLDGALQGVTYTEAEHATPGVSFTYDPQRGRLATMTDTFGTTTYDYYPVGDGSTTGTTLSGAGRLSSVSGPWANSTVSYEYDPLGRLHRRTVGDAVEQWDFDPQGRLQADTNALGAFTYGYVGATGRLASVAYPNGQSVGFSYYEDNTQDRRLSGIQNLGPGGAALSQFGYAYDGPLGRINSWTQQQGSAPADTYALSYDAAGQLHGALFDNAPADARSAAWGYDPAGNRTSAQAGGDGTLTQAIPSATNALLGLRGGAMRVAGSLDKPARQVQVNGQAARVNPADNTFEALLALDAGPHTVTVQATDLNGNTATKSWQVNSAGGVREDFSYDLNGNTTADTSQASSGGTPAPATTFEWDAADRVIATIKGNHRTDFAYDGQGNRTRITERENGSVQLDRLYVHGEERDVQTGQMLRRFFAQGEQRIGSTHTGGYFYTRDHLGSLRELTDSSGNVRARYAYGLWGKRSKLSGDLDTESGFTGYWHHQPSENALSPTRLYSTELGKFLSRDRIGEVGGINLYGYCSNSPVNLNDPKGENPVVIILGVAALLFLMKGDQYAPNPPLTTINNPIDGLDHYFLDHGEPVVLGPGMIDSITNLQTDQPFDETQSPQNLHEGNYCSLKHPLDSLRVGFTLGQFRYTNDGKTTTIQDFYNFPFSQSDWNGGTSYQNRMLSWLPGTPYPVSGNYKTP